MDRAAERRENRRRKRVKRVVSLIALSFILPMLMVLVPSNVSAVVAWTGDIAAEGCFNTNGDEDFISLPDATYERLIYVRWDLSGDIPEGATIDSVNITVYGNIYTAGPTSYVSCAESAIWTTSTNYAGRPTEETQLGDFDGPFTGSNPTWRDYWKNESSGDMVDRVQANFDIDGHMYVVFNDEGMVTTVTSYELSRTLSDMRVNIEYTDLGDETDPVCTITTPTSLHYYNNTTGTIDLAGTATDANGIDHVDWTNSAGGSGTCTGTTSWTQTVTLYSGVNIITITAYDPTLNSHSDTIAVLYSTASDKYFMPVADAYVDSADPTSNFGTSTSLSVYPTRYSFFRFDLTTLGADATFEGAMFSAYKASGSASLDIDLFTLDDDTWTETGITWNNQPDNTTYLTTFATTAANEYYDATSGIFNSSVQSQYDSDYLVEFRIQFNYTEDSGTGNDFRSKESTTAQIPVLFVEVYIPVAPVITNSPGETATNDTYYSWNATCTAADSGSNDWTLDTNASFLSLTGETESNVTVGGTPGFTDIGEWYVNVTVNDTDSSDSTNYSLVVSDHPYWEPTFTSSPDTTVVYDTLYSYVATCNETVTWPVDDDFDTDASFLSWGQANHTIYGTPEVGDIGSYWFNISATSVAGYSTGYQNTSLEVTDWRWAPTFTSSPVLTVTAEDLYEYVATANESVTWPADDSITTNATWLYWGQANHTAWGTPAIEDAGYYFVNISITSVAGELSTSQNWTLTVGPGWKPTITTSGTTEGFINYFYSYDCDTNESAVFDLEGNGTSFLSIHSTLGYVNGTPTIAGVYNVNISATSIAGGLTEYENYSLTITQCTDYILRPDGDDYVAVWTQIPASGSHFEKVDETTEGGDGVTTYVNAATTGFERYTMEDLFEESPCDGYDLTLWIIARKEGGSPANLQYGFYIGAGYYVVESFDPETVWTNHSTKVYVKPDTGAEWTYADLNALKVYLYTDDAVPSVRVTQVGVLVEFHDGIDPEAVAVYGYKQSFAPAITDDINFTYSDVGTTVWVNSTFSSDNLAITNYTWNWTFDGGAVNTVYSASWGYRFVGVGDYTLNLTVRDEYGNIAWDTHAFTLNVSVILRPDANGAVQGLTGTYSSIQDATYLDEVALHDANTSYLLSTDSNYSYFSMDDFAGTHVNETYNVTLFVWALGTGVNIQAALRNGTTNYWGITSTALTESYTNFSYTWTVCPWTAGEWTNAQINATIVNVLLDAADGRITKVGLIITVYPPDLVDPVAVAASNARSVNSIGALITLDGSGSTDNVGVVNWTWSWTQNETTVYVYGETAHAYFWTEGTFVVTLNVTDAMNNSDTDTVSIVVEGTTYSQRVFSWIPSGMIIFMGLIGIVGMVVTPFFYVKYRTGETSNSVIMCIFWFVFFFGLFYGAVMMSG